MLPNSSFSSPCPSWALPTLLPTATVIELHLPFHRGGGVLCVCVGIFCPSKASLRREGPQEHPGKTCTDFTPSASDILGPANRGWTWRGTMLCPFLYHSYRFLYNPDRSYGAEQHHGGLKRSCKGGGRIPRRKKNVL